MTWRKVIGDAWALSHPATRNYRRAVTQAAWDAGLTFRQIAEAAGVQTSTVYALIGRQGQRASLDDEAVIPE